MLPEMSLKGRTAIVTGAGRGIGREIALVLAEAGADVVIAARTLSEIESAAADVQALGRQALAVQTDVSRSDQVDALVAQAIDRCCVDPIDSDFQRPEDCANRFFVVLGAPSEFPAASPNRPRAQTNGRQA